MAKCTGVITLVLELSEQEAAYLKDILQNQTHPNESLPEEQIRKNIFNTLPKHKIGIEYI